MSGTAGRGPGGMKESLRLVLTLTVAGLLSGIVIVSAYELTLPRIEANKAAALKAAVFEVVPGSDHLERFEWADGELRAAEGPAGESESVYAAYDAAGELAGWAIPGAGAGFQDTVRLICGYDPVTGRLLGMRVLESRETPGLGDRILKDEAFVSSFEDLAIEPEVVVVKDGADADNEVDAITGATISSEAVVRIVNDAAGRWVDRLPPAGEGAPSPDVETTSDDEGPSEAESAAAAADVESTEPSHE